MALPTSITIALVLPGSYYGPFISSGNVYFAAEVGGGGPPGVWKATDPTTSFTEQDAAHEPTSGGAMWAVQDGTKLYLAVAKAGGLNTAAYTFNKFNMDTDLWDTTIINKAIATPTLRSNSNRYIALVERTTGAFIVLFNGAKEQLMGAAYERVSYSVSTDNGATWSAETAVGAIGVKRNIYAAAAVVGASNRVHFFYSDTTANAKHRSLDSGNVLDTEAAVVTVGAALNRNYNPGIAYVSGANTVVKIPVNSTTANQLTNVWLNSGANPTINLEANYSDATVAINTSQPIGCDASDGTTTHAVFSDATSKNLMHDRQDDGKAWGTDINEWTATINTVSANIYTRSGSKVLAVLVDDGGTVKYNELPLVTMFDNVAAPVHRATTAWWDQSRTSVGV